MPANVHEEGKQKSLRKNTQGVGKGARKRACSQRRKRQKSTRAYAQLGMGGEKVSAHACKGGGQGGSERAYAHTYKANLELSLEGRFKHEILVRISHESIQRRIYLKYPRPNPISMNINCFSIDEAVGLQSSMTRRGSSLSPSPG